MWILYFVISPVDRIWRQLQKGLQSNPLVQLCPFKDVLKKCFLVFASDKTRIILSVSVSDNIMEMIPTEIDPVMKE